MPKRIARPKTLRRPATDEAPATPNLAGPAEVPARFSRPHSVSLECFSDRNCLKPYVTIGHRDVHVTVPLESFEQKTARVHLRKLHILFTAAEWNDLKLRVDALEFFPPRWIAQRAGWTGASYVFPNGSIIAPNGIEPPVVLFEPTPRQCQAAGKRGDWKRGISAILAKANKPTFAVMAAFASPILALADAMNCGFEFVGNDTAWLDGLLQLVASVVSRPDGAPSHRYVISGSTPPTDVMSLIAQRADSPFIVADVDTYAANATNRVRAARFDELLVGLTSGTTKAKSHAEPSEPAAFVFIMTSRESASSILARLRPTTNARATERTFTVPMGQLKPNATVTRKIEKLTSANHAVPMLHFVERLVAAKNADEAALKNEIAASMAEFRERVGAATADPTTVRAIDAFALVYAAGRLAQRYGALPKYLGCMKAAVASYDANRLTVTGQAPFLDRLKALAKNPETLRVDPRNLPSISDEELDRLPAILRASPSGKDELLLTPAALSRAFPNKKLLLRDQSLVGIIKHDGGRITVKRAIRSEKTSDRVVCIRLP